MRTVVTMLAAVVSIGLGGPAIARAPMYAYKAGVAEDVLNVDETACLTDAQKAMRDPKFRQPYMYNPVTESSVGGAVGAGIARGFAEGIASGKRFSTTLYDCFVARGYSLRRMSDEDWKAVKKLPPDERKARMLVWRTGPQPVHPEIPRDKID